MNVKELLAKAKAMFAGDAPPSDPPATDPTITLPIAAAAKTYKLADGSEISIMQVGDKPAAGDAVTIGGVVAPSGTYILEDTSSITVGTDGIITAIVDPTPVTAATDPAAPAPAQQAPAAMSTDDLPNTPEALRALYLKFAAGTPEERIANLELVAKALMEYSFGWQIREAEQKATADQAINVYKQGLVTTQATLAKHEQTIQALFDLVDFMSKEPESDPKTLSGNKKDRFEKLTKRDEKFNRLADAIKKNKVLS